MEDDTPAPFVVRNSRLADRYAEAVEVADSANAAVREIEKLIMSTYPACGPSRAAVGVELVGTTKTVTLSVEYDAVVDWETIAHREMLAAQIHPATQKLRIQHATHWRARPSFAIQPNREEDTNG